MNRRAVLLAASAGLVVPSLLATAATAESETKKGGGYKEKTLEIGAFSKAISEMAEQKAKNARVKDFAKYETAEQTAISTALTNEADAKPPTFSTEQQDMLHKLGNESGDAFDKAYIKAEIHGHEELRKVQDAYLEAHGFKTDDGHIAVLSKAVIDMHLSMLNELHKTFG